MTTKAAFNAEEWSTIVTAPYLVGLLVVAADRGGNFREALAINHAYADAREHYTDGLLREIVTSPPSIDPAKLPRTPDDLRAEATSSLRRAVGLLHRSATEDEGNNYKRFVYFVGESVAKAHREGGFLGFGGTEVSEHEQAALDEIAAILDTPQSPPP